MASSARALNLSVLLKDIPTGAWVALSADLARVIAFGSHMRAVLDDAKQQGESDPIIARVPETSISLIL
jgi:hypothetical protein